MDINDDLKRDHAQLLQLAHQMQASRDAAKARECFTQLRALLVAHSRAEESVVYRALEPLGVKAAESTREGEVEHSLCDHLVSLMARTRSDTPTWRARARVVAELLEHHIEEEHEEMLPLLSQHFSDEQRAALSERFAARKAALAARAR